jgi:hypothetical protein
VDVAYNASGGPDCMPAEDLDRGAMGGFRCELRSQRF